MTFAANGYYAAIQAATPGYFPSPWIPAPITPRAPTGGGPYQIGPWGRPMFPLSGVRTMGGYGPFFVTASPVISLPPAPPLMDYVQINPKSKKK